MDSHALVETEEMPRKVKREMTRHFLTVGPASIEEWNLVNGNVVLLNHGEQAKKSSRLWIEEVRNSIDLDDVIDV
jgi:hypothetical protein